MEKIKNIYTTRGIVAKTEDNINNGFDMLVAIERFKNNDWGSLGKDDTEYQNSIIEDKYFNYMGVYKFSEGEEKFWIMAGVSDNGKDRIATVLLPEEY